MQNTLVIIFFAGGALFFLYRLIKLSQLNRRIQASQAWPQTSGAVTEAHVRHTSSTSENGHRNQHYYGEVKYTYQVMGASYSGSFKKDKAFSSEK